MKRFSNLRQSVNSSPSCFSGSCLVLQLCRKAGEDLSLYIVLCDRRFRLDGTGEEERIRIATLPETFIPEAADSIRFMFYFRQLMSDERFPDTINGIAVTPGRSCRRRTSLRSVPTDINALPNGLWSAIRN